MPRLQYLRIPNELTALNQWAVAALPDKAPRHPVTGRLLKTTEPNTWASFESVLNSGYPAIGFLLTKDDPYTVIDLDVKESHPPEVQARHDKIYAAFDTYAERSVSGVGRHIICRGKIHGGLHRDYVEVYDQERFILCTGAVLRPAPITEQGPLLARLVQEMGGITNTVRISASEPEQYSDDEILRKLGHARNADKFKDLYYRAPFTGEDWSQRDASLAQLLVFYSRNHEQLLRLFRGSKLYRPHDKYPSPERYENDYLLRRTFGKAIDHYNREAAEEVANIEHGQQIAQQLLSKVHTPADTPTEEPAVTFPPGLIGDVAQFILSAAERPVKEVALAGSLVFCAGLFGRQYNISNTGLNLYLVLLAKTGRGKEAASAGINKLMTALRSHVPGIDNYRGPGHIASGQGLIRHLNENQSCFSLLSEFGHSLKIITDARASAADARTKAVFLDLFTKSGKGDALLGSAYSDSAKNTHTVQAPAFSFLGDSTPATYYSVIDERLVDEGLIPRFLTIAYMGPRQAPNPAVTATPSDELVTRLVASAQSIMNMQHSHIFVDVPCTPEAQRMLNDFNLYCDRHINQDSGAVEIWNRAHLKTLRLSALVAIGRDMHTPVVTPADVVWAKELVQRELRYYEERLSTHRVGIGEARQMGYILEACRAYIEMSPTKRERSYSVPKAFSVRDDLIPYTYFRRRLSRNAAFSNDRRGLRVAIKSALEDAVEMDLLEELADTQKIQFSTTRPIRTPVFTFGPAFPTD